MPKSEFDEYFALRKKGAFREAYDVLLGILSTSPRWSRVGDLYVWCAELEMTLNNDLKRAQQLLEKARRLGCRYMDAYYRRHGILLCRLGRRRKGIEELERAVELSPSICSLMALAMELTEEEDGRALAVCHRVLDQDPESCWALTYMARLAARAGDRGKALLMIRRAERLSPSEYDIYDIAALWYELGEFQQAIHAYLEADRRGKQPKGPLYAAVAACYFEMGDNATGQKYLRWATRHD
ncbi:MAG: tetratricopeptide repeat protein, partial [Planctomycetota bacterium]